MKKNTRGYFTLLTLVFSAVFLVLLSALIGFIFAEKRVQVADENREQALNIAEAGLEYYRWFLAHNPNDLTNGTGHAGPYVHDVPDPEGGTLGTFSLTVGGDMFCGEVTSVLITSTGWTAAYPQYKRTLSARYTRPSVADYSHIVNSNVWAGADRVITGPYHSNQGVRMDGVHNADVTSGVSTWLCTATFGCSPDQNKNGVFGGGSNPELWRFPTPPINFGGITVDLATLEGYATGSGVYIPPSGAYGYRITMNGNGTLTASPVTGTTQVLGYTIENGWQYERPVISATGTGTNYTIPTSCPIVFVEDDVWLDGVVSGKVTLAAADVDTANTNRSIILNDNITYANAEGDGLTAIGENNVLVGLKTPDIMTIKGIFIAQLGHFSRNHYCASTCYGSGQAGDTGYKTASSTPVSTGWSNFIVTRLQSSDNTRATCDATCDNNDDAHVSDFNISIPSGATITGIAVVAEMAEGASSGNIPTRFSLSWNNGSSFTSTKTATVDGTGDANYTLGGSSDTWGRTWSDTDFANGQFRVRIDKQTDSDTLSVDYVRVRVYYTIPSFPASLDQYVKRSTLNTFGTVVSNGRVGTKWTSGGSFVSGYSQRTDTYDLDLSKSPPPFTPATSDDFKFVEWKENN